MQKRKVYLICPVRNVTPEQQVMIGAYVADVEASGKYEVHFPPRDVDQSNDDGGVRICEEHRAAMFESDEVHVWWDDRSTGSHFDLGMAYMLDYVRREKGREPIKFMTANECTRVPNKSFQNVLYKCITDSVFKPQPQPTYEMESDFADPLQRDSGEGFLDMLALLGSLDVEGLKKAYKSYGPSWKSRGGVGAFMMLARKWDRLENRVRKCGWDLFRAIATDTRGEGVIDDVRDLRRYLLLADSEMAARGFNPTSRDNKPNA